MTSRLQGPALAVAAVLLLLASTVHAQAFDPSLAITANAATSAVRADEPRSVTWVVRNTATAPPVAPPGSATAGTVALSLQVPAGWSASLAPGDRSFALAPGASRTITVIAEAEEAAPADGALVLSGTSTDGAGRTSPSSSAGTTLTFIPPPATIVDKDYTRFIMLAATSGASIAALTLIVAVYLARSKQVALFVDAKQRPITAGTDGIFLVQVENKGNRRREVEVEVAGLPDSWYAAFSFPKVQLAPGERAPVPLCVKVPSHAGDGHQVEVLLRARPSRRFPWRVHATTVIEAHDRVRIGNRPPAPPQA